MGENDRDRRAERANEDIRKLRRALMENDFADLDRRAKRSSDVRRKLWHEQRRLEKPARRGYAGTTKTLPTADSDAAHAAANGPRRRLPSAKKHFKRIGTFLCDPTSKKTSFPSPAVKCAPKEMKSEDDRGASVDKRVATYG